MKYGFIGGGNMGGAMALACQRAVGADNVLLVDRDEETTARLANSLGVTASNYDEIARDCRLIFIGVKPNLVAQVLTQLRPALQAREGDVAVVSIAAGVKIEDMCAVVGDNIPVIRNEDFGHGANGAIFPISVKAKLNTEDMSFQLLESGVK